ncbi:hypothetical protein HUG20_15130 [Salicibibacter cibi]|uniref:AB hydrolase-1 domain-containing protein n=1 Tax=Salicibibacter cibi TaxID=2743001 RepID=A0A7T6ZCZ2_9BACI|nr:alpha/beta fold hydrolase [Salicibibacter cibi]QQK81097.1 hypothetical protein HUG20_15130 [Salicibibacter cibi]
MKKNKVKIIFVLSIVLMAVGSLSASMFHSDNGEIDISDVNIVTEDGAELRAMLYVPESATDSESVPAVVAAHGYNNTAEMQSTNAIELARRGMVVISPDAYGHGLSTFPDDDINNGIVNDQGVYSALQYLGTLPYVDVDRIGMVGHSMGGDNLQFAALQAFEKQENDPSIVTPNALLPTSQSFLVNEENEELMYSDYPVNLGVVFGQYDEWTEGMWDVEKGSDINITSTAEAGMGFTGAEYGAYYHYGDEGEIDRSSAIQAADDNNLRVIYQPSINHPRMTDSHQAANDIIDFFDITLLQGEDSVTNQVWHWKEISTGVALIGFFLFIPTFGLLLLKLPFFNTIIRPEPSSLSIISNTKSKLTYWLLLLVGLIPTPFIYMWAMGYPIGMKPLDRYIPTIFPVNDIFPMPVMNGLVIFNIVSGIIALGLFIATFYFIARKNGSKLKDIGVQLPLIQVFKSLILAVIVFASAYVFLSLANYWFLTDFRFYVLSLKTITPEKVGMLLVYLPFFAFYFIISSLTFNLSTRIKGAKEWKNVGLILIASCASLVIFSFLDYLALYTTGVKLFPAVPYPEGTTSALAGVILFGLLFILPIAALYARIFFKETGSIWVGGFINSFIVTFFALSNTVVAAGSL